MKKQITFTIDELVYLIQKHKKDNMLKNLLGNKFNKRVEDLLENDS